MILIECNENEMKIGSELFGLQILTGTLCTLFLVPMHTLTSYLMGIKRALHHFNPQSGSFDFVRVDLLWHHACPLHKNKS
jgi:hypothetical protein